MLFQPPPLFVDIFSSNMATSVNIGGGDDQFNRYKMPPVVGKVEGRGNGIKTRIVNCVEVSRAIHRPPGYVCKFFGCELGAQTKIDDNAGTYIVNGAFQQNVLAETLQKFIEMYVLCGNCQLPETDLKIRKNGNIVQQCNACGAETAVDMTHKLCTFIINNPPDGKKKKSDGKKDKAARRALKAKKTGSGDAEEEHDDEKARRKAKKAEKKAAEQDGMGMVSFDFGEDTNGHGDDYDDVEWSVDTSKEAEEARKRELGSAAAILERVPVEDEFDMARKLRAYIDDGKKPSKVLSKAEKIFEEENAIRGIMMAAVVDENLSGAVESVKKRAVPVLTYLGTPMEDRTQQAVLGYLDWAGEHDDKLIPVLAHILNLLWETDLVEEEQVFAWFKESCKNEKVRQNVKIVVEHLEADDDDEDDSDDDDDE